MIDRQKKGGGRIFAAKATILLAQARKCRDADHLTNLIYDPKAVSDEAIERDLLEAREHPELASADIVNSVFAHVVDTVGDDGADPEIAKAAHARLHGPRPTPRGTGRRRARRAPASRAARSSGGRRAARRRTSA